MGWVPLAADAAPQVALWVTILVGVGGGALGAAATLGGQVLTRKGAKEADTRAKREEALANVRWAAERALDKDGQVGIELLRTLRRDPSLQSDSDKAFVNTLLDAILARPVATYHEIEATGVDPTVVLGSWGADDEAVVEPEVLEEDVDD